MKIGDPGLKIDSKMFVGGPIRAGDRLIYPVLKISVIEAEGGKAIAVWIDPKALVIAELGKAYAASLTDEKTSIEELIDLVPLLRNILGSDQIQK